MKKSTYKAIKSIWMFLFLLMFGIFIYAIIRTEKIEGDELATSSESDTQDVDILLGTPTENKPIGFEYQKITEQSPEV